MREKWVKRESKRERAMGGMIMEIRRELIEKGERINAGTEGLMVGIIGKGRER